MGEQVLRVFEEKFEAKAMVIQLEHLYAECMAKKLKKE